MKVTLKERLILYKVYELRRILRCEAPAADCALMCDVSRVPRHTVDVAIYTMCIKCALLCVLRRGGENRLFHNYFITHRA